VDLRFGGLRILIFTSGLFLWTLENIFFSKLWCAIPDVLGGRGGRGLHPPYWLPNMNWIQLKLTEIMTSQNDDFRFLAKSAKFVTSPWAAGVTFTSGFLFPVGLDLHCSNCRSYLLGNYYFRSGERRKIAKNNFGGLLAVFFVSLACHTGCTQPPAERSWRMKGDVAPYRPPNLNHFRLDLTGLLAFELGDFRFFGFRGCWETLFSLKWHDRHIIFI